MTEQSKLVSLNTATGPKSQAILTLLANIGDAMVKWTQASFQMDRECLGSLLLHLSRTQKATSLTQGEARDRTSRSGLSNYAMHFVEHIGPASYSFLFEVILRERKHPRHKLIFISMFFCNKRIPTAGPGIWFHIIWIQSCTGVFYPNKRRMKLFDMTVLSRFLCFLFNYAWKIWWTQVFLFIPWNIMVVAFLKYVHVFMFNIASHFPLTCSKGLVHICTALPCVIKEHMRPLI